MRIGACMHVTTETANLMRALKAAGAQVALCASKPAVHPGRHGSPALVRDFGVEVFAIAGEDAQTYTATSRPS